MVSRVDLRQAVSGGRLGGSGRADLDVVTDAGDLDQRVWREDLQGVDAEMDESVPADFDVLDPVAAFGSDPTVSYGHGAGHALGDGGIVGDDDDSCAQLG
jgi:hypothetical protein